MPKKLACVLCLPGALAESEVDSLLVTEDDFIKHLEDFHKIAVKRRGETKKQAWKRLVTQK